MTSPEIMQELSAEEPLMMLNAKQKEIRSEIREANKSNKTVNLEIGLQEILSEEEREFWNTYIERFVNGETVSPEEMEQYKSLTIKLGLRDPEGAPATVEQPQETDENVETPHVDAEPFSAVQLRSPDNWQSFVAQKDPIGKAYLFRGIKNEWQPPTLSDEEFYAAQDEIDLIINEWMDDRNTLTEEKGKRLKQLTDLVQQQGDQWFTDNAELALKYAGENGSVIRIAVDGSQVYPHMKGGGYTPGGIGNNFHVPRSWFLPLPAL